MPTSIASCICWLVRLMERSGKSRHALAISSMTKGNGSSISIGKSAKGVISAKIGRR